MIGKTLNAALATLLLTSSCYVSSGASAKAKADFIRVMREAVDERDFKKERAMFKKQKKAELQRNLLAKAKPVQRKAATNEPAFMNFGRAEKTMRETVQKRHLGYAYADADAMAEFGFDVSQYSMKYTGCNTISMYNDEMEEGDEFETVVQTTRFVTLRVCNTNYCSNYLTNGCESDYADYVVEMGDYLQAFYEYNEALHERYCFYCQECMYFEKYFYGNRDLQDADADAAVDAGADADADANADANADADAAADADADANADANGDANGDADAHACKYYDECQNYADICEDEDADADANDYDDNDVGYQNFFECTEYNAGNDDSSSVYLGPICQSDGQTISIGIFSDALCSRNIGDKVSIAQATGIYFENDAMADFYSSKCVTCAEDNQEYDVTADDEADKDDVIELCEQMQQLSAKCLGNLEAEMYNDAEENDESYQEKVCTFIENVQEGSYDENGIVKLDQSGDSIFSYSYEDVGIGQIFSLIIGGFALVVLITWSCLLHKALRNIQPGGFRSNDANTDLKPTNANSPLNPTTTDATITEAPPTPTQATRDLEIASVGSGIMMARSEAGDAGEGDEYVGGVMS